MLAEAAGSASGRGCWSSLIRLFWALRAAAARDSCCRGSVSLRQAAGTARDADGGRGETETEGISFRWWLREQLLTVPDACWGALGAAAARNSHSWSSVRQGPLEQPGTQVQAGTAALLLELGTVASRLEQHGVEDSGAARGAGSGRGFSLKRWLRVLLESHAVSVACSSGSVAAGAV